MLRDVSSLYFKGLKNDEYLFHVADSSPPLLTSTYPVNGTRGVANDVTVVLTFNANVVAGTQRGHCRVRERAYRLPVRWVALPARDADAERP